MTSTASVTLRIEYGNGQVPVASPRLSWATATQQPGWAQNGAELSWSSRGETCTALVEGAESVLVGWPFQPLEPRQRGEVRVRALGDDGWTQWSPPQPIVATFLGEGEWLAARIGLPRPERPAQPFLARHEFAVASGLRRATLYAVAQGVYQVEVNGACVDDQVLKPGWTPYRDRLIHETTDVTELLSPGINALGAAVAGGWFTERFGFSGLARVVYGEQPCFAAQLLLEYVDGTSEWIVSSPEWLVTDTGPWVSSGIYAGEHFDARLLQRGWSRSGFDASGWVAAAVPETQCPIPVARTSPEVRVTQTVPVAEVLTTPSGRLVVDFGQNLVGRLRLKVNGAAGTRVQLRHAEVLEDGEIGVRTLRYARATDDYILAGVGTEEWAPSFTFHGFRFAEITGWPGDFDPTDVVAEVIHSDMRRTGWFECSDPEVNRLHENVRWGMRGNFLYLPTDCPQRDERLGWTGDIQVFGPTASFLYDCDGFLASWLTDLALEQAREGGVPFIVPDVLGSAGTPSAGWGDVAVLLPWVLYQRFGDRGVLEAQYPSARAWVDQILQLAGERHLWEGGFQFGDWVDPDAPPDSPEKAKAGPDLVASAFLFRSASVFAEIARVLGRSSDALHYETEAERVRRAWLSEYVTPAGRILSDAQTSYALAIVFGLVEDATQRQRMGDRLAELVRSNRFRIGTGFLGTPLVADALTRTGHLREAGRMLLTSECPSWLYSVRMGATTIWERWDSLLEDGSINPGEMTSFNHYALGSIADWLHRSVGGLAPLAPGYRRLEIAPRPIPGLDWAKARHETPYGMAEVRWRRQHDSIRVEAVVPPNTTAVVRLPGGESCEVKAGTHEWTTRDPLAGTPWKRLDTRSELADIMDDREAYETVMAAIDRVAPGAARGFSNGRDWIPKEPLFNSISHVSGEVIAEVGRSLDALNRSRLL